MIDVRRFDAVLGESLAFDASWRVLDAKGKMPVSGQARVIKPAIGKADADAEAIAAAAGRAAAQMAREIAAALLASARP